MIVTVYDIEQLYDVWMCEVFQQRYLSYGGRRDAFSFPDLKQHYLIKQKCAWLYLVNMLKKKKIFIEKFSFVFF